MTETTIRPARAGVRLKSVALPAEHGGWGFLIEPLVLGLLVAPTWAGLCLGIAAAGLFLLNQPLKLVARDYLKGQRYPRTRWAERFALLYGGLTLVGAMGAILAGCGPFWLPLLAALPLALIHLAYTLTHRKRSLPAELAGAVAFGAFAPAIALAAGWEVVPAAMLWLALALRDLTSIVYVRARVRMMHGEQPTTRPVIALHAAALILTVGLMLGGVLHTFAVLAMTMLLIRCVVGIAPERQTVRAQVIGFQEIGFGLLTAVLVAAGF